MMPQSPAGTAVERGRRRRSDRTPWAAPLWTVLWVSALGILGALPLAADDLEGPKQAGALDLAGEWRLWVGDDGDGASPDTDDSDWSRIRMPATWGDLDLDGVDGPLWLRRTVRLPSTWGRTLAPSGLALSLGPGRYGAYRVFAGGREIGGHHPGLRLPRPVPRIFDVPPDSVGPDGTLHLAIRFDRVAWRSDQVEELPAPLARIEVGDRQVLHAAYDLGRLQERWSRLPIRLLGALLMLIGLYHLGLYLFRREAEVLPWLGATALAGGGVAWFSRAWDVMPWLGASQRLQGVSSHLGLAAALGLLAVVLGRPLEIWLKRYQLSNVGIALLLAVLPLRMLETFDPIRWLWLLPFFFYLGYVLSLEAWRGNHDARLLITGGALLVISGLAEVVLQVARLGTTYPLPQWAIALMIFGSVAVVASRHGRVHDELESLRQQLERMVEDRTTELTHANQRLQAEISERQLAEEAMRMLERAVEQSVDGIAVVGLQGEMQFMNEAWARMHGYEPFELLGYDLTIFHTPEQMSGQVEALMDRVRKEGAQEAEIEHRRRGGTTFPAWQTATFLHDSDGEAMGYVFIARDISERKKAEDERLRLESRVQQAEKLESLGGLAGGIAHDYNNLLTSVLGNISLALQELPQDHLARGPILEIETSAERAAELTDQLLAYAGEEQHAARVVSINDLIEDNRPEFEEIVPDGVRLDLHLKSSLPSVEVDPRQMRQVLLNLMANAADSLREDSGLIMLRTGLVKGKRGYFDGAMLQPERESPGPFVFFEVSDDGMGMDDETRAKMFDPFFSTKSSGRGLGLAAVLGIVRAHGGAIKVYSQPNRGTTVEVVFPAAQEIVVPPRQESGSMSAWEATGLALVVDDEKMVRDVAARVLQRQGFDVLVAADGHEALEIFTGRASEIRLVLLDHTMPGMDGEAVLRQMEGIESSARVLLMSGYREHSVMPEMEFDRLAAFLHKPFRPNDLLRKVREVLEPGRGRRRRL
ncbi:MAG: PAS domain S-box protein [Acidobacteriota bacterium]